MIFLSNCNEKLIFSQSSEVTTTPSVNSSTSAYTVEDVSFARGNELTLIKGFYQQLFLKLRLSNGKTYHNIKKDFKNPLYGIDEEVIWYVNDESVAKFLRGGLILAVGEGKTTVIAAVANQSTALTVTVEEMSGEQTNPESEEDTTVPEEDVSSDDGAEPTETLPSEEVIVTEEANDPTDVFLNDNDVITLNLSADGGFGSDNFPDILYGPPVDVYDVVSLGTGGSIEIELNGYVIADGDGADFTIFENPFPGWQECGRVSVSADGENYHIYNCDQFDELGEFSGCAGATAVSYGLGEEDYLDPNISGGDSFDLADLGLDSVRQIVIEDIGLCTSAEAVSLYLTTNSYGPNGFDLDAVAIINGVNE